MATTLDYEGDDDIIAHYENEESDGERRSLGEAEGATSDNETARRIDPSKPTRTHVIRNPAPKLNTERLTGPNGIQIIEKYFEGFKFSDKGQEKTDLDRIMKRLEHWSYRLFPKYHFDDFLARAEQLGVKKDLQVFIKKYRLDMINPDNDTIINDDEDNEEDQEESAPIDDFDLLITEQIQKQKQAEAILSAPVASTSNEDAFDRLLAESDVAIRSGDAPNSQVACPSSAKTSMSDDMKEKIERNKQLAIQRRLERQKEREEEIKRRKLLEDTNTDAPNENDDSTARGETAASQVDDAHSQIDETTSKIVSDDKSEETLSNSQDY